MVQIHCRGLLFDLDGVLIDSTHAVARVWTRWAIARGFDPKEVVERAHGRPSFATVREYLPDADHEKENEKVERSEMEDLEGVVAWPGARELLAQLPEKRWTIVTSCTRPLAEVRLRATGMPVPARMVTASDITHGKPHPEPYLKGAAVLGVAAGDCVVFEDAPAGVRAGKAAGARVIAFRTLTDEAELKDAGADWVVDDCRSVSLASQPDSEHSLSLAISNNSPRMGNQ